MACWSPTQSLLDPQIVVVAAFFGFRFLDRAVVWNNRPHDDMLLAEAEKLVAPLPLRMTSMLARYERTCHA